MKDKSISKKYEITPEALEEKRKKAGFSSQASAAKDMGVGVRTYQRWVSGQQDIPKIAFKYLSLLSEKKEKIL